MGIVLLHYLVSQEFKIILSNISTKITVVLPQHFPSDTF